MPGPPELWVEVARWLPPPPCFKCGERPRLEGHSVCETCHVPELCERLPCVVEREQARSPQNHARFKAAGAVFNRETGHWTLTLASDAAEALDGEAVLAG